MDTALILKREYDAGRVKDYDSAKNLLDQSVLLEQLLSDNFQLDAYLLMNRLNQIAEIPFTRNIPKVQEWLALLNQLTACGEGFSLTKKDDYILSCYNAMLTSLFIRMEHFNRKEMERGVAWIMKFQRFERYTETEWKGSGILRYGGCLKAIPCYVGVVKSVIALSDYRKSSYFQPDRDIDAKFTQGIEYILEQQVYLRRSESVPITNYIRALFYPFTWKINIIEILRMLKANNFDGDARCHSAKEYLKSKRKDDGYWRVNAGYKPKGWVTFDKVKQPGLWVSYEIQKILDM